MSNVTKMDFLNDSIYLVNGTTNKGKTVSLLLSRSKQDEYETLLEKEGIYRIENTDKFVMYEEIRKDGLNQFVYDIQNRRTLECLPDFYFINYLFSLDEQSYFFIEDYFSKGIVREDCWTLPIIDGRRITYQNDSICVESGVSKLKFPITALSQTKEKQSDSNNIYVSYYILRKDPEEEYPNGDLKDKLLGVHLLSSNLDGNSITNLMARKVLSSKIITSLKSFFDVTMDDDFLYIPEDNLTTKDLCKHYGKLFVRKYNEQQPITEQFSTFDRSCLDISFVKQFESKIVTTYFYENFQYYGGIHGFEYEEYISIRNDNGEILTPDLIVNPAKRAKFNAILFKYMKKEYEYRSEENLSDEEYIDFLEEIWSSNDYFSGGIPEIFDINNLLNPPLGITPNGIVACFRPNLIDAYAGGCYTILIPYFEIEDCLLIDCKNIQDVQSFNDIIYNPHTEITHNYYSSILEGKYGKALSEARNIIKLAKHDSAANHIDMLHDISYIYANNNNLLSAIDVLELAVKESTKLYGESYGLTLLLMYELASYYEKSGDLDKANILWSTVRDHKKQNNSPFYTCVIRKIAEHTNNAGNYVQSAKEFEEIILSQENLATDYVAQAEMLMLTAIEWHIADDSAKAQEYFTQAIDYCKDKLSSTEYSAGSGILNKWRLFDILFKIYYNQALIFEDRKNYVDALTSLLKADEVPLILGDREKLLIAQRKVIIENRLGYANEYDVVNVTNQTKDCIINLIRKYSYTNEEITNLWNSWKNWFDLSLPRIIYNDSSKVLSEIMYNAILFSKGFLLNSSRNLKDIILESHNNELTLLYNQHLEYVKRLNNTITEYDEDFDEVVSTIANLERKMMDISKDYRDVFETMEVNYTQVHNALDEESVAVEFFNFVTHEYDTVYYALIARKDFDKPLACCIANFKYGQNNNHQKKFTNIWSTLYPYISNKHNIFFSPAGELYNIPIESYHYKDSQSYVTDYHRLYRVSSTRVLINPEERNVTSATIYGGIDYDTNIDDMAHNSRPNKHKKSKSRTEDIDVVALRKAIKGIPYLPGSLTEVNEISQILKSNHYKKISTDLYTGKKGSEESFKALSGKSVGLIHLATHGFYITTEDTTTTNISCLFLSNNIQYSLEDKMLSRSGLFLSGAENTYYGNPLPPDIDDGVLTAQEISMLDFRKVELVTLSACRSGLGVVSGSEIFGLQRGFKKAGVNSILMALWDVADDATCLLMTEFYKNWANGKSKYESLELAKKTVRSHTEKGWNDPKYWAAFVLIDALD